MLIKPTNKTKKEMNTIHSLPPRPARLSKASVLQSPRSLAGCEECSGTTGARTFLSAATWSDKSACESVKTVGRSGVAADRNVRAPLRLRVRRAALLICSTLALAVAGCSSVSTHVDKGRVTARTFSFLNTGRPLPSYADDRQQAHVMVQQALIKNLAAKGVSYVPTGGDVTVAYLIVVGNNAATTSLNSYFGYTEDSDALVEKVHAQQTASASRGYFEAGTLVIDILDPRTSKLLQRRSIQAQVLRNLPIESRTTRVQGLVDEALKDVPISP